MDKWKKRSDFLMDFVNKGDLGNIKELVNWGVDATFSDNLPITRSAVLGHLHVIQFLINVPTLDVRGRNNNIFYIAASKGHLNIIKFMLTIPGVDPEFCNNQAITTAIINGHIHVVKFLLTLPSVNTTERNNMGIIYAARTKQSEVIRFMLTLPNINILGFCEEIFPWLKKDEQFDIIAILLYDEPFKGKISQSILPHRQNLFASYNNNLLELLRLVTHKVAVSMTELPTPILIEIIEQMEDFAIYMPYHIKWNMVIAIKHSKKLIDTELINQ